MSAPICHMASMNGLPRGYKGIYSPEAWVQALLLLFAIVSGNAHAEETEPYAGEWRSPDGNTFRILLRGGDAYYHEGIEKDCVRRGRALECLWPFGPSDWDPAKTAPSYDVRMQVEGNAMIGMVYYLAEDGQSITP